MNTNCTDSTPENTRLHKPNLPRRLFWEFRYAQMDWDKAYRTVISHVIERGREKDWEEMLSYYGREKVVHTLKNETTYLPDYAIQRVKERLGIPKNALIQLRSRKLWNKPKL